MKWPFDQQGQSVQQNEAIDKEIKKSYKLRQAHKRQERQVVIFHNSLISEYDIIGKNFEIKEVFLYTVMG